MQGGPEEHNCTVHNHPVDQSRLSTEKFALVSGNPSDISRPEIFYTEPLHFTVKYVYIPHCDPEPNGQSSGFRSGTESP